MEGSIVEKLDKSRYNFIKWCTVSWGISYGTFIIKDLIDSTPIKMLLIMIGLVGWVFWMVNLIKVVRLGRKVNADDNLKISLNDELYQHNIRKSFLTGYVATIVTIVVLIGLAAFSTISALIALEIVLYVSVLSTLVASLLNNRN